LPHQFVRPPTFLLELALESLNPRPKLANLLLLLLLLGCLSRCSRGHSPQKISAKLASRPSALLEEGVDGILRYEVPAALVSVSW